MYSLNFNTPVGENVETYYTNHEELKAIGEHDNLELEELEEILEKIPECNRYQWIVTEYNNDGEILETISASDWLYASDWLKMKKAMYGKLRLRNNDTTTNS
jgi:hypothetical protein